MKKLFSKISVCAILFFLVNPAWAQHEDHTSMTSHDMKAMSMSPAMTHSESKNSVMTPPTKISDMGLGKKQNKTPERVVNLFVSYKMVNFSGQWRKAIAVNNQIPAPTLHFKEGDHVTINVYNQLDKGTSVHWHGIIVPWQMDGVTNVTQKAIPPGGVFHYHFTLYQSGTYWYHAHAEAQEQDGLYGAFLIDPLQHPRYHYTKDDVIVLSDWSDRGGEGVYRSLKKEGDYFSPRFPLQPSLSKFIHDYRVADSTERQKLIADYKMMQQMRMSIYDLSDVAYDAYLLNGLPYSHPWTAPVKVGDVVRLRFIGAAGSTIYHVKIPGAKMEMVHVQGNDVTPYSMDDFSIAPGETEDVLVKIQENRPYIIYAESIDTLGKAYGALITDPQQPVNFNQVQPFPEPLPVTREMMNNMMMSSMGHDSMNMSEHSMNETHPANTMKHAESMSKNFMNMPPSAHHHMENMAHPPAQPEKQTMPNMSSMTHNMNMSDKDHSAMNMSMDSNSHTAMPKNQKNSINHAKQMDSHMNHSMSMDHAMNMPTEPSIVGDHISPSNQKLLEVKTTGTKYQNLVAAVKTNDPNKPVDGVIRMELFGYMDRFIWFINGLPEYKAKPILIEPGKRYRIIFTNNSMMRHPMHIHLHWFILRNGHGAYDPLVHTIEVPPGATAVADVDTDASGQAFFHCHHLYHMMAGMARVFQYQTILAIEQGSAQPENIAEKTAFINRPIVREDEVLPIDPTLVNHPMGHHQGFYFANFLDIGEDPFHNIQSLTFKGLYGGDYNKLELFANDAELNRGKVEEADLDIFYWHLLNQFWAIKGGANYFNQPSQTPYWQPGIGIEGLLPYFIEVDERNYYHAGSVKFDLELSRDTQLTNNFFIKLGVRSILATQTVAEDEIGSGLNQMRFIVRPYYRLAPGLSIFTEYEREQDFGELKNIRNNIGESTSEDRISLGLSLIF
jgi:CopA family copper-resistance protein